MSEGNPYPFFFDFTDAQDAINDSPNPFDAPAPAVVHPYPHSQAGPSSGTGSAVGPIRSAGVPSMGGPFAPYTRQRPRSTESRDGQGQPQASNVALCKRSLISAGQIVLIDRIHRFGISTDRASFAEEWNAVIAFQSELAGSGGQMGATVASSAGSSSNLAPPALMYVAPIPLLSLPMLIVSGVLARRGKRLSHGQAPTLWRREMRQAREGGHPSINLMQAPKQSHRSHLHR
ncbi:hypothetical protein BJ912DRAFT_955419 [Pholiota molesta]|nr:hypothetical protein BJ912DRAFT_955419 [Pholiota molesta]